MRSAETQINPQKAGVSESPLEEATHECYVQLQQQL